MDKFFFLVGCIFLLSGCGSRPAPTPAVQFVQATVLPTAPTPTPAQVATNRAFEGAQPVAIRVNNEPVLLSEFQAQVADFAQSLAAQGTPVEAGLKQQIIQGLVDRQIIEQYARQTGILVTDTELTAAAQKLTGQTAPEQLEQWLTANNRTYPQLLADLRFQLTAVKVFEQVTQNAPRAAEQIKLQLMVITAPADAQAIANQIAQGKTLPELADEQATTSQFLDWFPRVANLVPATVTDAAFSLQPGQISGPIKTQTGYYIIKLEGKESNRPLTPSMAQQFKLAAFNTWLQRRRALSRVEQFVTLP